MPRCPRRERAASARLSVRAIASRSRPGSGPARGLESGSGGGPGPSESLLQISLDRLRRFAGSITLHHSALFVDQEFGKIPLDRLGAQRTGGLRLEILIQRV